MAIIHRVSFYAVNANDDNEITACDVSGCLECSPYFGECFYHQIHVDNSKPFEWRDDDPLNYDGCDLAHIAKHFTANSETEDAKKVKVGAYYRHFKGKLVQVLAVARNTETQELSVVYAADNGTGVWNRPLSMFLSKVDHEKYPDVGQKYRFELFEMNNRGADHGDE